MQIWMKGGDPDGADEGVDRTREAADAVGRRRRACAGLVALPVLLATAFFATLFVNGAGVSVAFVAAVVLAVLWSAGFLLVMRVRAQTDFRGDGRARLAAAVWGLAPGATAGLLCSYVMRLGPVPSVVIGVVAGVGCAAAYLRRAVTPKALYIQMRHTLVQPAGTQHARAMARICVEAMRDPRIPRLERHFLRLNYVHAHLALSYRDGDEHQAEADRMVRQEIEALRNDPDFWPLLGHELFQVFEAYAELHADRSGFDQALEFLEHSGAGLSIVRAIAAELRGDHETALLEEVIARGQGPDSPFTGVPAAPDTRRAQLGHVDAAVRHYRRALELTGEERTYDTRVVKLARVGCRSAVLRFELGEVDAEFVRGTLDTEVRRLTELLPHGRRWPGSRGGDLVHSRLGLVHVLLERAEWGIDNGQLSVTEAVRDLRAARGELDGVLRDPDAYDWRRVALSYLAQVLDGLRRLGHEEAS
ncbi:hypothetical protein ACWDR3_00595 [Streptomyces sp. NPDC001002]